MLVGSSMTRPLGLWARRSAVPCARYSSTFTTQVAAPQQEVIDGDALAFRPPAAESLGNASDSPALASVEQTVDPTAPPQFGHGPTTHFRVVQARGMMGTPWFLRRIIAALGLRHRMQAVYLPHHATVAGELLKVKELIRVDNVRRLDLTPEHKHLPLRDALWVNERGNVVSWGTLGRTSPRGYKVVGNRLKQQGFDRDALKGERALPNVSGP